MSVSGRGNVTRSMEVIESVKHACNIKVKTGTDTATCIISGLATLPGSRLVLADNSSNCKLKTVNLQSGKVLTELKMLSSPWDVAAINNDTVAVTMPDENKIAIVSVRDDNLSMDITLAVSRGGHGVDYRNGKLAVSFFDPHKVQVLNLQGTVLYTISADKQGKALFYFPYYLTFGQDDTTLYVSNCHGNNVLCVKLDGTVVATYTDSDLKYPLKPVVDNHGNVYVCTNGSYQVHQTSKECNKIKVLLTRADGLVNPYSICLSEEEDKFYVGMHNNNTIKVYTTECRPK